MNTHYTYFYILAAAFAGPFLLSFDKKVAFYKNWRFLFFATLGPAVFYIAWDMYFTSKGVWGFNEKYITGIKLINLPVEEVLFFFVVPYCCVFVYQCIRTYFPALQNRQPAKMILQVLAIFLLVIGLLCYNRYYTSSAFIFCGLFISAIYIFKYHFADFDASSFLISFLIILVPFLVVNGFLTALPVVTYNDEENLGLRIYTIPFEDIFYGMLLVLMNVAFYERLRNKA